MTTNKKEKKNRQYWEKVFSISKEENEEFDKENDRAVQNYNRQHRQLLIPKDTSIIQQLTAQQFHPITIQEICSTLKQMKNKAPGKSQIRKPQLTHLPNNMLQDLQ